MAYQVGVYRTSGGDELVVESSGNIAVHSGGAITFASGATLTLAGQALTSTGALTANSASITSGITGSSMAITNGITASSAAITNGITASSAAVTNGITASSGAFTNGVTMSSAAVTNGITASSAAVTNGITASSATLTNGIAASTGTFTGGVALTSGISALRFVNNTIAAASSGSTGFVSYGITQVWSSGTSTGTVFTMPAAASAGVEKYITCLAATSTAPAVVTIADTLIAGNTTITFSSGSAAAPQWIHLMAENTTNWFVLGLSTGALSIS